MAHVVNHPAVVNPMMVIAQNPNVKDSRWLTLEVCREYQRSKCSRSENECKFAHPPPHVEVQNGRVVACFDSIKGKCQRKDPPCKYLHPPQHLREQLLQNGRNNLILKNLQLQALHSAQLGTSYLPVAYETGAKTVAVPTLLQGQYPYVAAASAQQATQVPRQQLAQQVAHQPAAPSAASPYDLASHYVQVPPSQAVGASYSPYIATSIAGPNGTGGMSLANGEVAIQQAMHPMLSVPTSIQQPVTKPVRPDRLESSSDSEVISTSPATLIDSFCLPTYVQQNTIPGVVPPPYKRIAVGDASTLSKGGIPVYQPNPTAVTAYHNAALMPFQPSYLPMSFTGHPPSVPRF